MHLKHKIALFYLFFGYLWVLLTDLLFSSLLHHPVERYEILKGIIYVTVTAILLHILIARDNKKLLALRNQALLNEEKYKEILNHANDGLALYRLNKDDSLTFLESNDLFVEMTGYTRDMLTKMQYEQYITHGQGVDGPAHFAKQIKRHGRWLRECLIVPRAGDSFHVEVNSKLYERQDERLVISVFRNIQDRKGIENMMIHRLYHDDLTDLPNARSMHEKIQYYMQSKQAYILLVIQIHRFQMLHDAFGRRKCNHLLLSACKRLMPLASEGLLAKMDGETFKLVLDLHKKDKLPTILQTIEGLFKESFTIEEEEVKLDIHIGIAYSSHADQDPDLIIQQAYRSLYAARKLGQVYVLEADRYESENPLSLRLENDLRKAVIMNQIEVYCQPQFDCHRGSIHAIEALVRWQHPSLGLLTPQHFIGIAEETGYIVSLGEWVLREACRQTKQLQVQLGSRISVSVNVSMRQFLQSNIVEIVDQILADTKLEPSCLMLEITESMIMDPQGTIEVLSQLKKIGVKISIDDFGTGYSSLSYLRSLPVDELKIDKSFISEILNSQHDRKIVSTIIELAHSLGLQVVAEGVENIEQVQVLGMLACDRGQGYFVSPPVDFTELQSLLTQDGKRWGA